MRHKAITGLREALITGDVPTADLWLEHAATPVPVQRGVALMEALADATFGGRRRAAVVEELIDSIENWVALEEPDGQLVLEVLLAQPARFGLEGITPRLRQLGALLGVGAPRAKSLERYSRVREALVDSAPRAPRSHRKVWRLDRAGGIVPVGAEVPVSRATAVALAELRNAAAALCGLVSEAAIGPFCLGEEADASGLDVRCAPNYLAQLRSHVAHLQRAAAHASEQLASPRKRSPLGRPPRP